MKRDGGADAEKGKVKALEGAPGKQDAGDLDWVGGGLGEQPALGLCAHMYTRTCTHVHAHRVPLYLHMAHPA